MEIIRGYVRPALKSIFGLNLAREVADPGGRLFQRTSLLERRQTTSTGGRRQSRVMFAGNIHTRLSIEHDISLIPVESIEANNGSVIKGRNNSAQEEANNTRAGRTMATDLCAKYRRAECPRCGNRGCSITPEDGNYSQRRR